MDDFDEKYPSFFDNIDADDYGDDGEEYGGDFGDYGDDPGDGDYTGDYLDDRYGGPSGRYITEERQFEEFVGGGGGPSQVHLREDLFEDSDSFRSELKRIHQDIGHSRETRTWAASSIEDLAELHSKIPHLQLKHLGTLLLGSAASGEIFARACTLSNLPYCKKHNISEFDIFRYAHFIEALRAR